MPTSLISHVNAYLDRLGMPAQVSPTYENLRLLHRAHVERIPFETLDFQLGMAPGIAVEESFERIARQGRGGYCFHLNGAFSLLLTELGYEVVMHRVGVQKVDEDTPPGINANHMALTVTGLAAPNSPKSTWLVDVGLGFALHEPVPLRKGRTQQGPFGYELSPSGFEPDAWRLDHRPVLGFAGADISARPASSEDFADQHALLSSDPDSDFVRLARVQRRDAHGTDLLLGCVLTRITEDGDERREVTERDEWFGVLRDVFGLGLEDLGEADRTRLWAVVQEGHEAWQRSATGV